MESNNKKTLLSLLWVQIFIGIVVGLVFIFGAYSLYEFIKDRSTSEEAETGTEQDLELAAMNTTLEAIEHAEDVTKLARVGKEYLFITDFDNYLAGQGKTPEEVNRDEVIDTLIDNSILLQLGEEEGWITLDQEVFNNPFKDQDKRVELLITVREEFYYEFIPGIYVEVVSVWFNNQQTGQYKDTYGLEAAKNKAYEKIEEAYQWVTVDNMSMRDAAQKLIDDPVLAQLDPNYENNAFMLLRYDSSIREADESDDAIKDFVSKSQLQDISDIILRIGFDPDTEEQYEEYYIFVKVDSERTGYGSIEEWIEDKKDQFIVEIY